MRSIDQGKSFRINNIYFDNDDFSLITQAKNFLISFMDFMQTNPSVKVSIHGHTDNVGDDKSNQVLSSKRAKEVHDYLIEIGADAGRLSLKVMESQNQLIVIKQRLEGLLIEGQNFL